jgi:hypothetical protein
MTSSAWNRSALIRLGVLAGLAQVSAGVAMYVAGVYFAPWSMLVSLVVLQICIVVGTRWYARHFLPEGISYKEVVIVGVVISVSTGLVYAIYNLVSIAFIYPHFLDDMVRATVAQRSGESFEALRAQVSAPGIAIPNLIRLSVFGTVLSLVSASRLRTRK